MKRFVEGADRGPSTLLSVTLTTGSMRAIPSDWLKCSPMRRGDRIAPYRLSVLPKLKIYDLNRI